MPPPDASVLPSPQMGRCTNHKELLLYWCRDCQAPLCASCRVTDGHDVVRTKVVLKEKREELKEHGQAILDNVLEEKRKIMDSVTTCSAQLLQVGDGRVSYSWVQSPVQVGLVNVRLGWVRIS